MATGRRSSSLIPLAVTLIIIAVAVVFVWRGRSHRHAPPRAPAPAATVDHAAGPPAAHEDTVILAPGSREAPGLIPTTTLRYRNREARSVTLCGSWDFWTTRHAMQRKEGLWTLDMAPLKLPIGRYAFKFLPDDRWEDGENRVLMISPDGLIERPSEAIVSAELVAPDRIDVVLRDGGRAADVRARVLFAGGESQAPPAVVTNVTYVVALGDPKLSGCMIAGDTVVFTMDERTYDLHLSSQDRVTVAGSMNGWRTDGKGGWHLSDADGDRVWTARIRMPDLPVFEADAPIRSAQLPTFKFVVNGSRWLEPPRLASNTMPDGEGHTNLRIDPRLTTAAKLRVELATAAPLDRRLMLILDGIGPRPAFQEVGVLGVLDGLSPASAPGTRLSAEGASFRVFAPRARALFLHLYDGPLHAGSGESPTPLPAARTLPMAAGESGCWELDVPNLVSGQYYAYEADGTGGAAEGFDPNARFGDPYACAVAHAENNAILLDRAATNTWFSGWTDAEFRPPAIRDLVIYETHVRNLTSHPSSGVDSAVRGKYAGLLATRGLGTGLDHLKALGVNAIELLPTAEFGNGSNRYDWGYASVYYFAPEASYARDPLAGSQFYEFKQMVNALHAEGFAVILDVVYNHVGSPNIFALLDRLYYFRRDANGNLENFSGCGNDVRSEAPMVRRLIIDSVLYWMREHHVDGFRFDLAELIDQETLMAVRDAARDANPNVILISEPWSLRGDHRHRLTGTGWSAWNGDYRYAAHRFVRGEGGRDGLKRLIRGSVDGWAATPAQSINYLESHDDRTFADEITLNTDHDGSRLTAADAARNRLGATILLTSLGVPMLAEGQEWIRSKFGHHNTFDGGDAKNALRWDERKRPEADVTAAYYQALVRLRLSDAGRTLRWDAPLPGDYIAWIEPPGERALGYIMNGNRAQPGAGFAVLLNAGNQPVTFTLPLPPGRWRLIGDGHRIDPLGIPTTAVVGGPGGTRRVTVPAVSAYVLIGG